MTDLDPTEPVAGRPRRLALWWLLLAVVGVVGFVALRPGDDGLPTTGGAADTASDTTAATSDPPSPAGEGEAPTTEAPPAEVPAGEVPPAGGPDPGAAAGEPTDGDAGPTTTARRSIEAADADEPEPNTVGPAPVEGGCLPGYGGACVPPAPPILTCADLGVTGIIVFGDDPHGLDDDLDGEACPPPPPGPSDPSAPDEPLD